MLQTRCQWCASVRPDAGSSLGRSLLADPSDHFCEIGNVPGYTHIITLIRITGRVDCKGNKKDIRLRTNASGRYLQLP